MFEFGQKVIFMFTGLTSFPKCTLPMTSHLHEHRMMMKRDVPFFLFSLFDFGPRCCYCYHQSSVPSSFLLFSLPCILHSHFLFPSVHNFHLACTLHFPSFIVYGIGKFLYHYIKFLEVLYFFPMAFRVFKCLKNF